MRRCINARGALGGCLECNEGVTTDLALIGESGVVVAQGAEGEFVPGRNAFGALGICWE